MWCRELLFPCWSWLLLFFFNKTAPAVFYYSYTTANSPIITIHTHHIIYPFIVIFIIFVERPRNNLSCLPRNTKPLKVFPLSENLPLTRALPLTDLEYWHWRLLPTVLNKHLTEKNSQYQYSHVFLIWICRASGIYSALHDYWPHL